MLLLLSLCSLCLCGEISSPVPTDTQIHIDAIDSTLTDGWYYIVESETPFRRRPEKSDESYYLLPTPIVTAARFASVELVDGKEWERYLSIKLDAEGTIALSRATGSWLDRKVGLVIDNRLVMAPVVRARIDGGAIAVTGAEYTREDLLELKRKIESRR
jgi:preprotein translocase subunit SecD